MHSAIWGIESRSRQEKYGLQQSKLRDRKESISKEGERKWIHVEYHSSPELLPEGRVGHDLPVLLLVLGVRAGLLVGETGIPEQQGKDNEGKTDADTSDWVKISTRPAETKKNGRVDSLARILWTARYDSVMPSRSTVPTG